MPKIKIDHVVSFSSEDPVHVANNILVPDPAKKWKCKEAGDKSATIVLQLDKACVISAIDIGNESSAYIEVLVSRSGSNDDYKVLLVMSSFMTPVEARNNTNPNKVRMFVQDELSKPESEQKWDRVKIVCMQPFNRHIQYGLSFITLHTLGDKLNGTAAQATVGKFKLRPDSPDNLSAGMLFGRRTELKKEPLTAAAAIREATASPSPAAKPRLKINTPQTKNSNQDDDNGTPGRKRRNRNDLLYNEDEEAPNAKIDKIIEKKNTETKQMKEKEENVKDMKEKKAKQENKTPKAATPKTKALGESSKRRSEDGEASGSPFKKQKITPKVKERPRRPFHELLKNVTIVISGIQNPDRGILRTVALSMGAKYKPDWDDSCTHLICAFTNTPKFNQVKGKGKIVKRDWLAECNSQRKRLPWRRYCLDKNDAKQPESEDEIWEEIEKVKEVEKNIESSDDEGFDDTKMQERIAEIQNQQKQKANNSHAEDTDEEVIILNSNKDIPKKLLEFLDLKTFFIDESLDEDVVKTIERYVIAYKGIIAENPSEDVDYFITSEENSENWKGYNSKALCVRPDWLWDCHNNQKIVAADDYLL